jgi:mycothiol S-conjugate amidase
MALHEAMVEAGLESPYEQRLKDWGDDGRPDVGARVTTRVPCSDYFDVRDKALLAHATQVDPTSFWFACPLEIQQRAYPTEDYELARSLVDTTKPEDDLFAGIKDEVRQ